MQDQFRLLRGRSKSEKLQDASELNEWAVHRIHQKIVSPLVPSLTYCLEFFHFSIAQPRFYSCIVWTSHNHIVCSAAVLEILLAVG